MQSAPSDPVFPVCIESPSGLAVEVNSNGTIRRLRHGEVVINLFPASEVEGGPAGIHLRRHDAAVIPLALTGPGGGAACHFMDDGFESTGRHGDLVFRLRFILSRSAPAWFWHVEIENTGPASVSCDLMFCQDVALAHYGAIRLNEYYVSQYVDHTPLDHPQCGTCIASRQNQSMGGAYPWLVTGSLGRGVSFATDALQVHGYATRGGGTAPGLLSGLPGKRLQHEHSMVSIQDGKFTLPPGAKHRGGFFCSYLTDHPDATSAADTAAIDTVLALAEAGVPEWTRPLSTSPAEPSLFASAPYLGVEDLDDAGIRSLFGDEILDAESDGEGLLSFFTRAGSHVVLRRKEFKVLRPHGHILRSGGSLIPDESSLTSTAWMGGVFHSMITQGHVSINRFLSTCHSYLGLFRSHGQRVFVECDGRWHLLGIPSAFAMDQEGGRWIYQYAGGVIELRSSAPDSAHELNLQIGVIEGPPVRFLISHHVAMNGDDGTRPLPAVWRHDGESIFVGSVPDCDVGWRFPGGGFKITPASGTTLEQVGGDGMLYPDGASRNEPFVCLITAPSLTAGLKITGHLVEEKVAQVEGFWKSLTQYPALSAPPESPLARGVGRIGRMLPWFVNNALVHYLSPRGLEQYSGGGWGTRDVCQGPVELLLGLGRPEPVRDLLLRVFRQQNPDGDWPQWFMFFERERGIRPGDSHGDIVYWPLLALAQYLDASGDAAFLDVPVPYFHPDGAASAETASIREHVDRALELILGRVIPGTNLAAYGHGDWNDSLQPLRADMRDLLCSSWTVTLNYQTFVALAAAFKRIGITDKAAELETMANHILDEFQRVLIVGEAVAGYAYFHENGGTDFLIHPQDQSTGLSYSLLPMIHAIINDMFTLRQAEHHLGLIRANLTGPDGAHLFNRPMAYRGGPQTLFQRAESASYFGREIGIMYTHAHLRYCEALARFGDVEGFFHALSLAIPIGIRDWVPSAAPRQANCYYSSSDPAFSDRYEAFSDYGKVKTGEVPLEGGWRVYSSGAGISARLVTQCFLGVRELDSHLVLDPVIPPSLDGMTAVMSVGGCEVGFLYRIGTRGCGPMRVNLNGVDLDFTREDNRYRPGAARIPMELVRNHLADAENRLTIWLE